MKWQDIKGPHRQDLTELSESWQLPHNLIEDCLDPEHLPKIEKFANGFFIILRSFDPEASTDADEVGELTRKVAMFVTDQGILTIHRTDQPFLKELFDNTSDRHQFTEKRRLEEILTRIILGSLMSFTKPVDLAIEKLNKLEEEIFVSHDHFQLEDAYYLRRRISSFRRIFRLNVDIMSRLSHFLEQCPNHIQEIRDELDSLMFYTEETFENLNTLLQLHISLSSQRVNEATFRTGEVVRVLTIFSVFLLPLNLVTGVYGMNFQYMPELSWKTGYPMALGLMGLIVVSIYLWFHKQGWLK